MKTSPVAIYFLIALFLISCSAENKQETQQTESDTAITEVQETASTTEETEQVEEAKNMLLVGIWQSLDDPTNFMEFTDTDLNWSPGSDTSETEPYELSKNCLNASNEFAIELQDPQYISVKKSDLCWYIVNMDENNLELAYAGRGNTTRYKKVESVVEAEVQEVKPTFNGILTNVSETGIYGLWSITVKSDNEEKRFQYDNELSPEDKVGSPVVVEFSVREERSEIDVLYQDTNGLTSIYKEYSSVKRNDGKIDSAWNKVEGIMIAEHLAGDTPAPYFIETDEGEMVQFEAFVDENYQARNGERVIVYYRMEETVTATSIVKLHNGGEYTPEVNEIILFVARLDEKAAAGQFEKIAFEVEEGGGFTQYERSMDGASIKLLSVANCSDHGCDRSTYYFSENQLVMELNAKSYWVGQQDRITENRTYFANESEILCLERKLEGEGGYDAVLKELQNLPHIEVKCGEAFNVSSLDELKTLTEENAEAYFFR